ncbi:Nucleolar complex protein 2 [Homalodisca vitripennis]|nr:Nucleolar complex protein 2 [Homalodisca vitripennis]
MRSMMYVAYISNSKFMSVATLPNISFMRRSLAEMFCLDMSVSYQHTFLYIRQLAIHLRNAITVHKKESIQAVCNWQYMNSLRLWVDLICTVSENSPLRALLYPLVQVIVGCVKLVATAQYMPLRFHCCQLLTRLSKETGTYIPVLPFIVESLTLIDFNKKHQKVSMKPMDFTCILRMSKAGLGENGFRDAIVEQVYQLLIEYCAAESHRISFPDIIVPSVVQMSRFESDLLSEQCRGRESEIERCGEGVQTHFPLHIPYQLLPSLHFTTRRTPTQGSKAPARNRSSSERGRGGRRGQAPAPPTPLCKKSSRRSLSMRLLRSFVKDCRTSKYSQKIRQALAKIEESGRHVEAERRKVALHLGDVKAVAAWETGLRTRGTPLANFHQSWQKVHQRQVAKRVTDNDKLGDFKLPQIKRPAAKKEAAPTPSGPVELFPSDSDSDNLGFGAEEENTKKKRVKRTKKNKSMPKKQENIKEEDSGSDQVEDIVEELRLSDLE